ncbi:MAG TPA: hypothetical protein VMY36_00170 [Patescibacteria group bacterium]|nr:hypothetical protein [Patescibacteria group bacterium]
MNGIEEEKRAQYVGPRSAWEDYRDVIEREYNISFTNGDEHAEPLLHEFYTLRIFHREVGEINQEEVKRFWKEAEEELPGFSDKYERIIGFIVRNISVESRF